MSLRGVIPPLVTPFREDGALDLPAFEANLEALAAHPLAGFLVLGSNGEAASLEPEEKLALVKAARRRLPGRFLLVGTGVESTRATVALTAKAAGQGADAVLVLTPHYYKSRMSALALRAHFEAVAAASEVPVYLYSVPAFTGLPWPPMLASQLAAHPRIAGIKESSGDLGLLSRIVATTPARFEVACGNAPVFYPALCAGASGGVLAVANCAPRVALALLRAFECGDHARARRIQEALTPLAAAVTTGHGVAGLKRAMDALGLHGGSVRAPLLAAPPSVVDEIRPLLERAAAACD
ncbi:MAG TPA: dihydrodipicolinate synthase family protein [Vicinamibacteria bacterium]|nr:dihydrodipicolinate synthase family protein [Vicinamibacteria bacterium]